ncbi:hypothetical protein LCGC14_0930800 [marine sediment metagenome]|uniref:Uncharacterized protein n=1 Tax=marine sediment metagenome TaxID=412755 RepID=A0A0F9R6I1_9ZZZZ|nr:hypothetical protein [archaeon]
MVKKTGGKKDLCVKDQEQLRVETREYGKIKIEFEIPEERYNEFEFLCKKIGQTTQDKIRELVLNAIYSSELDNF